jgi:NAD(P)-dependent dehydrogenase (short-subunit alcohol dehydrogenase family)
MPDPVAAPMHGKRVLITGGTGGIGRVAARALAQAGAEMILVGRSPTKGRDAAAEIAARAGAERASFLQADLSAQAEVRRVAEEIAGRWDRLDVLINNAGAMFGRRRESADGIEMTLALNHLSYYLLTRLLFGRLKAAAPARIVNVASGAHRRARLRLDDLQSRRRYRGFQVYSDSKLCNVLFTYELARRIDGSGVTANCLHPGFVATEIGTAHGVVPGLVWGLITRIAAITPEEGARTPVYLASSPEIEGVSGKYFDRCRPTPSSHASHDRETARRLWDISADLTGLPADGV